MASAAETYEGLAPFYDELTREHDYEGWTHHLEQAALEFGVSGSRLLDAACGTGKSFLPFLERRYEVTACDISPEMVELAQRIAEKKLSVREAERLVKEGRDPGREPKREQPTPQHRALVEELQRLLGTKVRLLEKGEGKGTLEIDFFSYEDLDRLLVAIRK